MARPYPPAGAWPGCLMPSRLRRQCYLVGQVGPQSPHPAQVQPPFQSQEGDAYVWSGFYERTRLPVATVPEGLGNGLPIAPSAWSFWVSFKTNRWGRPGLSL